MGQGRTRSPLATAAGLGSAKHGAGHWWMERVTAVALVPLTLWFVGSIVAHRTSDYAGFIAWLKLPWVALLMVLLLAFVFYHMALGLQVVIEDYVHSTAKIPVLVLLHLSCFAFAAAGIFAALRIAFSG
jgi:succinate dehydrogenase / fumarate reductase membrane anchor subunit